MTEQSRDLLIDAVNLTRLFPLTQGFLRQRTTGEIRAVDGVSLQIYRGETLGVIGVTGCGKTTLARLILLLDRPTSGSVYFLGHNLALLSAEEMRPLRRRMQIIAQDSAAQLDRKNSVEDVVAKALVDHYEISREDANERVAEQLTRIGLPADLIHRNLNECSPGLRQAIGAAIALSSDPDFLVCDEPVALLDPSAQARVINVLEERKRGGEVTYLYFSHDLSMVRHLADRIAVMQLGELVEMAEKEILFTDPLHPYTQAMFSAIPIADPVIEEHRLPIPLTGEAPSSVNLPMGCRFRTCCPVAASLCAEEIPEFREIKPDHWVRCHLVT